MTEYQYHPLTEAYRVLSLSEQRELANDIKANGLKVPIVLYMNPATGKKEILDGRHRYQACLTENVKPLFEEYVGSDPVGHVKSLNEIRRHMTLADRKEAAKELLRVHPELSSLAIARQTGVSDKTVTKYRNDNSEIRINDPTDLRVLPDAAPASVASPPREAEIGVGISEEGRQGAPTPRREASGREARGRKPQPQAPTKTAAQQRDEMVVKITTWLNADISNRTGDLIKILMDLGPMLQEKIVPHGRIMIAQELLASWGLRYDGSTLSAA